MPLLSVLQFRSVFVNRFLNPANKKCHFTPATLVWCANCAEFLGTLLMGARFSLRGELRVMDALCLDLHNRVPPSTCPRRKPA
jgi:hypothetical protein